MRNLDVTTLRSFVAVADLGGVTKAAGFLHLTQSAVSMQIKRLEEALGLALLDRSGRGVTLTAAGEQLLGYARRMVTLNDEVIRRLTDQAFEGEISLGVPYDVVYPAVPQVLQQFAAAYPRVKVRLVSSFTRVLRAQYSRGELDLVIATESSVGEDAQLLCSLPLSWIGARGGATWRRRPLRIASSNQCVFRSRSVEELDRAGLEWEFALDTDSDRTVEATVAADLAVTAMIEGTEPQQMEVIDHGGALPDLGMQHITMYGAVESKGEVLNHLALLLRTEFRKLRAGRDLREIA